MNKIEVLIVEDDQFFGKKLEKDLTDLGYTVVGLADNAKEAMGLFYMKDPDLVIMDIHIKGEQTGIDIAKLMQGDEANKKPVIFLTSDNSPSTFEEAKELLPFAYMQKPVDNFTLQHQMELALHYASNETKESSKEQLKNGIFQSDFFYIKKNKRIVKVFYKDILYAEVESNYSTVHTTNENFTIVSSLRDLTTKLPGNDFLRIHKNYIVNLHCVKEFNFEEYFVIVGSKDLPIGKKFKARIIEALPILS